MSVWWERTISLVNGPTWLVTCGLSFTNVAMGFIHSNIRSQHSGSGVGDGGVADIQFCAIDDSGWDCVSYNQATFSDYHLVHEDLPLRKSISNIRLNIYFIVIAFESFRDRWPQNVVTGYFWDYFMTYGEFFQCWYVAMLDISVMFVNKLRSGYINRIVSSPLIWSLGTSGISFPFNDISVSGLQWLKLRKWSILLFASFKTPKIKEIHNCFPCFLGNGLKFFHCYKDPW